MATAIATKTKWAIDTTHSEAQFKVKHLVISSVTGSFKKFQGDVSSEDETFDNAEVNVVIDTNSIDTNQADRDGHLKSEDFFAAERFPTITFNGVLEKGDDYKLVGELTIRDVKKPVTLDVEFGGDYIFQLQYIVVSNMSFIRPWMNGDSLCTKSLTILCCFNYIGQVTATGITERGEFVDVD